MNKRIPRQARALIRLLDARSDRPLRGAEIGILRGDTSAALLRHFPELFLWMVDSWATYPDKHPYRESGDGCAALTAEQQLQNYDVALANTNLARKRCRVLRAPSLIAQEYVPDESLDFIFVDGDHTYDGVRADLVAWWPKVRNGGVLTGHDYGCRKDRKQIWGVARAVDEFAAARHLAVAVHGAHVWSLEKPAGGASCGSVIAPPRSARGVILYNRGAKCLVRMLVCIHSLRKWWRGPVAAFLEGSHPIEFEDILRQYDVAIIRTENSAVGAFIRKVEICFETPFDRSVWLDSDTVVCGPIDELFDFLDDYDVVTPHFAGWWSNGRMMSKRIRQYRGKCPDEWINEALKPHPAVNMGVYAFRSDTSFLLPWLELSRKGDHRQVILPEEIAFQVLYPRHSVGIVPLKFGVSVKHDPNTPDPRIIHYHGQKHVHDFKKCRVWKDEFHELINSSDVGGSASKLLCLADRRLRRYLEVVDRVTLVTACDRHYVEMLRLTFPSWVRLKRADRYPIIVFVNGIPLADKTLDFLRLPNVRLISWDLEGTADQREKMLSSFVFGAAEHVQSKWWMKLDADTYATDDRPFLTEEMKKYVIFGHRWGTSLTEHIVALDEWAKTHPRLDTKPMFDPTRVKGKKYCHSRTQSFAQMQSSRFTRYCARLAGSRLPVPSHDTYLFYVADRLGHKIGRANFKTAFGLGHHGRLKGLRERLGA